MYFVVRLGCFVLFCLEVSFRVLCCGVWGAFAFVVVGYGAVSSFCLVVSCGFGFWRLGF